MTAAFVERSKGGAYDQSPYIVLRIDAEGAEYLSDVLMGEVSRTNDGGAWDIYRELQKALETHRVITMPDYGEER